MTVSTTASRVSYSGNGATTAFSFPYEYRASADLKVVIVTSANVATLKTLTTHYTVSGVSDSHGGYSSATVTMVTAPASGETLVLYRAPSVVQAADVESESDPLYAVNNALDLATLILQRLENDALKLPIGVTEAFSATLPDLPDDDAVTYYLGPSSDRTSLSWLTASSTAQTISSAWLPVVTAASLAAGRDAAGLGSSDDPTFRDLTLTSVAATSTVTGTNAAVFKNTADAASNRALRLESDRATPANGDTIVMGWYLSDSAGNQDEVARLNITATDVTSTSEDARWDFWTVVAGTLTNKMFMSSFGLGPTTNDGMSLGLAVQSWSDVFIASGGVVNWNNGTYTLTQSSTVLSASGGFVSVHATSGVGYATGAGGAVTQITSRSTGVTLNKICGAITTDTTSLAAEAAATFTVTNSAVAINDTVVLSIQSGSNGGNTAVTVTTVAAGSFAIKVSNNNAAAGTAETGAIIINFAVIKSVSS